MITADNIKNFFGQDAEFDHVGIAVRSISSEIKDAEIVQDPIQKVNIAFIYMNTLKVELIEPSNEKSPVVNILQKGQSLYHLCFKVPDIREAVRTARANGFHSIARPAPAIAFNNKKIAWVFSKVYGLIELLEKN